MITTSEILQAIANGHQTVFNQWVEEQRQLAIEEALRVLPGVVHSLVLNTAKIKELKDGFFKDNPDLNERREFFLQVLETTEAENPGMDYKTLFPTAAAKAREQLRQLNLIGNPDHRKPPLNELDELTSMFETKP